MTADVFREYVVNITASVSAPSAEEAAAALSRSGIVSGALIGETLIETTEVEDDD